jgi:hypothetical protein
LTIFEHVLYFPPYKQTLTLIQDTKVVSGGDQIHSWIWVNGQRP